MLEPLAATVLHSVLPTRPLAAHFFTSKSAFGMAVRTALPHDFFTPHASGSGAKAKGKGRALPEHEHGTCSRSSTGSVTGGVGAPYGPTALSSAKTLSPRHRSRRIPGYKCISLGSTSHIPSLRTWTRQVYVAQRRHASSRAATATAEAPRRDKPRQDVRLQTFNDIVRGRSDTISPEDAWQAFHSIWHEYDQPPGPPTATLAFLGHVIESVVRGDDGPLSQDLLQRWGKRVEAALHHVDPGIQDMPGNRVRYRWNALFLQAMALLGKFDEAEHAYVVLFHHTDPAQKVSQRTKVLQAYTVLLHAVRSYRGARAVLDLLVEHAWLNKYLVKLPPSDSLAIPAARLFEVAMSILSSIADPVRCLDESLQVFSKGRLSAMGSLLVLSAVHTGNNLLALVEFILDHSIPLPDRVVYIAAKKLARLNSHDAASKLLGTLSPTLPYTSRLRPDWHSTALFLASRKGSTDEADKYFNILSKDRRLSPSDGATYLQAYAVAGKPHRVVELFNNLFPLRHHSQSRRPRPNIVHYTIVIYAHAQAGDLDGVNLWLGKLSHAGIHPDLHVYSIILQAFASRGDVESMISILDQMREAGVNPSLVIYTTLISILAERQDPMAAERIYKRAIDSGVVPDRIMVTAVMNAHVEAGSWHGVIRAFDYLNTPGRPGAVVSIEVFNTLMKAYVLIGAPFRVVANLFRQLQKAHLRPDARTFALLIQSACDNGFMEIAEDLYNEMERLSTEDKQTSLAPNAYAMTILMNGYLRTGRRLKAKGVLDRMKERGLQPNAVTYAAILKAYSDPTAQDGMKVAENLLQSLMKPGSPRPWLQLERGRILSLETIYRPLLNAYNKQESVYDVERLHQELMEAGGEPTLGTLTALLDVHRRTGNIEAVRMIWPDIHRLAHEYMRLNAMLSSEGTETQNLRGHGVIMCVPLSIYVDALSAAGEHAEVARVWKALKDEGLSFDSHNWNHLVTALVRAGELHRAFDIVENVILKYQAQARRQHGRERDLQPSSPLVLDLPPPEEGDLPPPRPEAPLHDAARRTVATERSTKRLRNFTTLEEKGSQDFAHPLHLLQQLSPLWNTWRPHGATLTLLGRVLDHLRSGKLVQPVRPNADVAFEQAALDEEEIRRNTEAAGLVLGRIYDAFPRTVQLIQEYELMKRSSQRGMPAEDSS
ncbi:hypothetical protein C8Q73DRAFT_787507 [Cubamyces lactineus]|nr:hypothetical protein C8Q73DRAFT_787507 [Cubamyces lactineus]